MNEGTSSAAIAVNEGVDGLELRVRDRGAHHGVAGGFRDERGEVGDESRYFGLGWRNELRTERAPPRSADPVLLSPKPSREGGLDDVLQFFDVRGRNRPAAVGERG